MPKNELPQEGEVVDFAEWKSKHRPDGRSPEKRFVRLSVLINEACASVLKDKMEKDKISATEAVNSIVSGYHSVEEHQAQGHKILIETSPASHRRRAKIVELVNFP